MSTTLCFHCQSLNPTARLPSLVKTKSHPTPRGPKSVGSAVKHSRLDQEHCNLLARRQHRPTEKLEEDTFHCKYRQGLVYCIRWSLHLTSPNQSKGTGQKKICKAIGGHINIIDVNSQLTFRDTASPCSFASRDCLGWCHDFCLKWNKIGCSCLCLDCAKR